VHDRSCNRREYSTKNCHAYQTPEQIVKSAGIVLYPEDKTKLDLVGDLADGVGLQLNIDRATAFIFTLYGKTSTVRTQAATIKDMLPKKVSI